MRYDIDKSTPRLLIVGASTRAAAQSAWRGGMAPVCIDLYGDCDLREFADVVTVADLAAEAPAVAAGLSGMPWMYCGGLENHPHTVAQISACGSVDGSSGFRLLGNAVEALTNVRDPWWVAEQLEVAGVPSLEIWPDKKEAPPRDGGWLQKPIRGAGGRGISIWDKSAVPLREPHYFQRLVTGQSYSAQFLALPGETILLGITRQLVGIPEVHAAPFAWCGTLAPASTGMDALKVMQQVGETISSAAGLRGLFGCDFVVEGATPWLTEVNPRYTAAMELLDFVHQASLIAWHVRACENSPLVCKGGLVGGSSLGDERPTFNVQRSTSNQEVERRTSNIELPTSNERIQRSTLDVQCSTFLPGACGQSNISSQPTPPTPPCKGGEGAGERRVFGKIVLFADSDLIIADATELLRDPRDGRLPLVADVPAAGTRIPKGFPVCTLFAAAESEESLLARLLRRAARFRARYLHVAQFPHKDVFIAP